MRKRKKGTLLQEGTIRRFMKLANMEALQENYFDHYGLEEQEEEEEVEMGAEEELPGGGEEEVELGAEEEVELGGDELGGEEGGDVDVDEAAVKDLVDTIATAIEDKYDIPISVEGGEGGEEELGGEEEVEFGAEEEEEVEMGAPGEGAEVAMGAEEEVGAEEELMELLNAAGIEVVDNEPVVQEVLKRVAKRLIREKMGVAQRRQRPPQQKRPQKRRR